MYIIGRSSMIITSENERVNWLCEQGNLTIKERKRERGGGEGGNAYSSRRSPHYSKCLQVLIQGEMLT